MNKSFTIAHVLVVRTSISAATSVKRRSVWMGSLSVNEMKMDILESAVAVLCGLKKRQIEASKRKAIESAIQKIMLEGLREHMRDMSRHTFKKNVDED